MSPILAVHIGGGTLGLVSGAAALSFRKGSRWHALAGKLFVASMLTMAAGAIFLAIQNHEPPNIMGGILTFYMILTAWLTARRADGTTSKFDWVALLVPLAFGLFTWFSGIEKLRSPVPSKDGVPVGMNFFLGSVMLLAAAGDVRMLLRGGLAGTARIARHLWRMCFGLFIATGSFFLGPSNRPLRLLSAVGLHQRIFRTVLREEVLLILAVLPLLLMIFWLVRVRFTKTVYGPVSRHRTDERASDGRSAIYGRVSSAN
jgi:uncharacterized membrane protein